MTCEDGLPECGDVLDRLRLELKLTPADLKDDAKQEAWRAFLSGENPARAVNTWVRRERRHRARMKTNWIGDTRDE